MTTRTAEASAQEIAQLERDLYYARRAATSYRREAAQFRAEATEMLSTAHDLTLAAAPLRQVLQPIRQLHTPLTWEGNAATASRRRLDAHEDRCNRVVIQIDNLIEDLNEGMRSNYQAADRAENKQQRSQNMVWHYQRRLDAAR